MGCLMDLALYMTQESLKVGSFTKDNGEKVPEMEKENMYIQTILNMMENGLVVV